MHVAMRLAAARDGVGTSLWSSEDAEETNSLDDEQYACTSLDETSTDRHLRRDIKDIIVCLLGTSKV